MVVGSSKPNSNVGLCAQTTIFSMTLRFPMQARVYCKTDDSIPNGKCSHGWEDIEKKLHSSALSRIVLVIQALVIVYMRFSHNLHMQKPLLPNK